MTERPDYYLKENDLQKRVQKLEEVKGRVQTIAQNLGGDLGPKKLNFRNPRSSKDELIEDPLERALAATARATRVAAARNYIASEKIPNIDRQITEVSLEIQKNSLVNQLQQNINSLNLLRNLLTPEEIAALEEQIRLADPNIKLENKPKTSAAHTEPQAPTPPIKTSPAIEPEKHEEEIMLDGEPILVKAKLARITLKLLINTINGDRVTIETIALALYGEVTEKTIRNAKSELYSIYHTFLEPRGYNFSSVGRLSVGTSLPGLGVSYLLEKTQPEGSETKKAPVEKSPVEKDEIVLPKIIFDKESQTIQFDNEPAVKLTPIEGSLVNFLYNNPDKKYSAKEIYEILKQDGQTKAKGVNIVRATMGRIEQKLNHQIFKTNRERSIYSKWSLPRQVLEEQKKPVEHITQITFNPENNEFTKDGQVVKIPKYFGVVVKYLSEHKGEQVTYKELFIALNKAGSNTLESNVSASIDEMMKKIASTQDLGELIQLAKQAIKSGKVTKNFNVYSLSPKFSVTILGENGQKPLGEQGQEISEAENIRRQGLLDAIHLFNLIETRRKVLEVAISYNENTLGTNETWIEAYYGEEVKNLKNPVGSLDVLRRDALKEVASKIKLIRVWQGKGHGKKAGYYLELIGVEAPKPPAPPVETPAEPKPEDEKFLIAPVAYKFDPEDKTLQIGDIKVRLTEGRFAIFNFLYINSGHYINSDTLDGVLARLPSNSKTNTAQILYDIRRSLGIPKVPLFSVIRAGKGGSAKYALGISPETTSKKEFDAEPVPTKDHRERMTKFKKQLPDGREISILGRITADSFDLIINTTEGNPIPTEKISHNSVINLRKILKPLDYEIVLKIDPVGRKSGQKGAYYLKEVKPPKDEPLTPPAPVEQPKRETSQADIDLLTGEINELQTRISSIEGRIASNDLSNQSNPMLEGFRKALNEKRTELAEKVNLFNSLPPLSSRGEDSLNEVIEIPYQRPPETIRTADETNLLVFIADELTKHDKLYFDRIQEGLHAQENPLRSTQIRGTSYKRFEPFNSSELKVLFTQAYEKMEGDSLVPRRKEEWNTDEKSAWEKLQTLLQNFGEGKKRKFFQRVNGLIDRASREYYDMNQDKREGMGWII